MAGRTEFGASLEPDGCCLCGKPLVDVTEETDKQTLTVETTEGKAVVLHYHEACFQEWLGNREHIGPASRFPKAQFIR
jgi:hypothetical protein